MVPLWQGERTWVFFPTSLHPTGFGAHLLERHLKSHFHLQLIHERIGYLPWCSFYTPVSCQSNSPSDT